MITLTDTQLNEIIANATAELVSELLATRRKDLELLTGFQVEGLLNIDARTFGKSIPRVVIAPNVYRYRAADVAAFIKERTEKP